ncbi:ribonuclease H-like domain-containing protein [Tanacetum coccineum]
MTTPTNNSQMYNDIMATGSKERTLLLKKHAYIDAKAEAVHMILSGIRDEIYSTVDACTTAKEMWIAIERLQQCESLNKQDVKTNLFWKFGKFTLRDGGSIESSIQARIVKICDGFQANFRFGHYLLSQLFDILKQYQNEVNDIRGEKISRNANPLALVVALNTSSNTRNKNVDTSPRTGNNSQTRKFMNQRTVTVVGARETIGNQAKDYTYHKEKMMLYKPEEKDSRPTYDVELLEQVQSNDDYNVFATERQHSEQPESINDTYVIETVDSNVIPNSLDMCDNEEKADQNAKEYDDEHVVLANLIANLITVLHTQGQIKVLPPRTAEEIVARERERKMWDAIKSRFGGNDESKKMQKYTLKQQFEGFSVSNSEGLHNGYDRFQSLLSQLEIHGAGVSTEDSNQKFLRSLPFAWSQISLIMRTKPVVDSLSFDDLYNNLRVFENDVKGSTASSSSSQNVAFISKNTSSTNDVSTSYNVSNTSEQLDEFDLEEMDLKWQVDMISIRMKKFYKKTGRKIQFDAKEPVGFDKTKVEFYNCHKTGHFARECRIKGNQDNRRRDAWNSGNKDGSGTRKKEDSKALVTIDGEGVDWTSHSEEDEDYALMACNNLESDTEVTFCSNKCKESYAKLKKLYDAQREQLSDASIEIKAYTQGLKKVEAQLVAHQQGQLWYEEKIRFMKIDLDDKTDVLTYHKKLLAEAQKEKEDLKAKVEKWHNSSKNLGKLLNTQMSANDKFGLGYGDHRYDGILSYENEVLQSVFMNKESELEKQPLYDRFVTAGGMHAVPPPMTGNYMPSGPDIEVDYSQFTYGPKQTQPSESETQTSEIDTCESNISTEPPELVSEPVVNESNVECQPKVWSDAPIIEEYESDSEDEYVSLPTKEQETPSFANQQVKSPRETVKNHFTHSKNPRVDKKGLVYGFTARACFVCGSLSHLIRDCDFHEKRMAKQAELNNSMRMKSSQREIRPIWNNVQRVNNKNQFVPTAVLTRTGKIPVNTARASGTNKVSTARHDFNRQAVLTSAAMKVNTVKPIVNRVRPTTVFHKTHSPFSRPFNNTTALRTNFSKQKVNTAKVNAVSAVGGERETAVKPSAGCNWRPQRHHNWHNVSKYNSRSRL